MSTAVETPKASRRIPPFVMALIVNFLWINASEVFRYFVFIMPMMREAFPMVPHVAPMNLPVFLIWGGWDAVLVLTATVLPWMAMQVFGSSALRAVVYGTGVWMSVFVILWVGLFNMNLAPASVLAVALPMAWLEMVVAALIVWSFTAQDQSQTK